MYQKGDIKLAKACGHKECDEGSICERASLKNWVYDNRGERGPHEGAYLEHSCSEWFIGGPKEMRDMISDLEDTIYIMEKNG